jgi:hypothetical protein
MKNVAFNKISTKIGSQFFGQEKPSSESGSAKSPGILTESPNLLTVPDQCSGSMTFWGGSESGSGDPCLLLMDPDPAIFVIDLQDASKKLIFNTLFSAYYFLKIH